MLLICPRRLQGKYFFQTSLSNYKQIDVSFTQREMEKVIDFSRVRGMSSYSQIAFWLKFSSANCEVQLKSNVMQRFIRRVNVTNYIEFIFGMIK